MLGRKVLHLIVVEGQILPADAVLHRVEPFAGLVRLRAVGQVPARVQRHAEDGVAGGEQRGEDALIGLTAGVRLHVGEAAIEELPGAVDGEILRDIDVLAAAVVAPPRIAFGVFVRHHAALRLHHGAADDVL